MLINSALLLSLVVVALAAANKPIALLGVGAVLLYLIYIIINHKG